jgi:hypothetical protein
MVRFSFPDARKRILRSVETAARFSLKERFVRFLDLLSFIENANTAPQVRKARLKFRQRRESQKRKAFLRFLRKYRG